MNMPGKTESEMGGTEIAPRGEEQLDFDYQEFAGGLIPAWRNNTDKLMSTATGRKELSDPGFRQFLVANSQKIDEFSQAVADGDVTPESLADAKIDEAREVYLSHASLVDMQDYLPSLDLLARSTEITIDRLEEAKDPRRAAIRRRRLASMLEEMSLVSPDEDQATRFAWQALELNQQVIESPELEIISSPRQLHALFSQYDIAMRSLVSGPYLDASHRLLEPGERHSQTRALLIGYHSKLAKVIAETEAHSDDSSVQTIDGSIGSLIVLGWAKYRILREYKLMQISASSSFLRQDNNLYSGNNIAFDANFINHERKRVLPTEFKKLTVGGSGNGRPNGYSSLIEVVQFRMGKNRVDYLNQARLHCEAVSAMLSGQKPTGEQLDATTKTQNVLDLELDRVFRRLDTDGELATDYEASRSHRQFHYLK